LITQKKMQPWIGCFHETSDRFIFTRNNEKIALNNSMTDSSTDTKTGTKTTLRHHWKALLLFGLITIGAGIGCLISPNQASIAVDQVIGIALILTAIPLGVIVARSSGQGHRIATGAGLVATVLIGAFLLLRPESGVVVIAIAIAAWFVIHGTYKIVLSFRMEDTLDRGLMSLGGFLNLMAAVIIFKFSEDTTNNHEALAAGVGLIFSGVVWLRLALRYRQAGN
jgi:uncharacterized membrane protein HdeD (DUF308 family)